jgi:hypothetical protein
VATTAISTGLGEAGSIRCNVQSNYDPPPLSRGEWNSLPAMIMRMDWKLDQIMEELEIEHGEEED